MIQDLLAPMMSTKCSDSNQVLPVRLSACPSVRRSVCPPVRLSACPSCRPLSGDVSNRKQSLCLWNKPLLNGRSQKATFPSAHPTTVAIKKELDTRAFVVP